MADSRWVSLGSVTVLRATEKALLCRVEDEEREVWIPRSQIAEESEVSALSEEGDEGDLVVAEWFARQEGLG